MNEGLAPTTVRKQYNTWASFYDHTFGRLVARRQREAVEQLPMKAGDRVLEIGVGTGMLLPMYPNNVTVVGIDLSDGMLKQAKQKCDEQSLSHCHLVRGDAMHLPFADHSFDHVMLAHVVSVVSDPVRLMQAAARVVKPAGTVVVLNHFRSRNALVGWVEKIANPLFMKLGWRSDLKLKDAMHDVPLRATRRFKLRKIDLWTIVVLEPIDDAGADSAANDARETSPTGKLAMSTER